GNDGSGGGGSAFIAAAAADPVTETGVQAGDGLIVFTALGVLSLSIVKVADRNEAAPGDTVNYTVEVVNTGNFELTNVSVVDPQLGIAETIPALPAGAGISVPASFTIPASTPAGPFVNTATAQADQVGPSSSSATVLVSEAPALLFTKSVAPQQARPGDTVTYTITAVNTGNAELLNLRLTDPTIGLDQTIGNLGVGSSVTINWPFTVQMSAPPGFFGNLTEISGSNLSTQRVGISLDVLASPQLSATKTVTPNVIGPGGTVLYTVDVTNTGNVPLTNVRVTDEQTLLDTTIPELPAGATESVSITNFVPVNTPPLVNTNIASIVSDQTPDPITASAVLEILAVAAVGVRKVADRQTAAPGETVTFEISASNLGNVIVGPVQVTDTLTGFTQTIPELAVNETQTVLVPFTIPVGTLIGSQILNVATITAPGAQPATSGVSVTVVSADLAISKEGSQAVALPGDTVIYTFTVSNLTPDPQTNVALSDPLTGFAETIPLLAPGDTIVRTAAFTIPASAVNGAVIENTLTVSSDQTPAQNVAFETVVQTDPAQATTLAIQLFPDQTFAQQGETVVFVAEVTNTGGSPATNIVVSDSLTGTSRTIPALAPGRSASVSFPFAIPPGTIQGTLLVDTASAVAPEVPAQFQPVTASASVFVSLPNFFLTVELSASPNPVPSGGQTIFTIVVTNVSDPVLTNVRVFGLLTGFSEVIPALQPGESQTFQVPFTVPAGTIGGTEFQGVASAFSDQSAIVQAFATVVAESSSNAILTHTVDPQEAAPGDTVVFTIHVVNTGNVPFFNGRLVGPLLNLSLTTEVFQIGADETFRIPFVVPENAQEGDLVSVVTASSNNGPTLSATAVVHIVIEEE
ncbi:hypothetical protein, partial [Cohnella lubricantis]